MNKILLLALLSLIVSSGCAFIRNELGITQRSESAETQSNKKNFPSAQQLPSSKTSIDINIQKPVSQPSGLETTINIENQTSGLQQPASSMPFDISDEMPELQSLESAPPIGIGDLVSGAQLSNTNSYTDERSYSKIEQLTLPHYEKSKPEKPLPAPELKPPEPQKLEMTKERVMINVEGMPIPDFITHALGNTLKIKYFMDERIRNMTSPVTLRMSEKVPAETAFEIVMDILRHKEFIIEQRKGILYILITELKEEKKSMPDTPFDVRVGRDVPESGAWISQFVPLKHIRPGDIENLINELYKTGVKIKSYPRENAFLFTGQASSIKDIISFIDMMDVPYLVEKKLFLLPLIHWKPGEFIGQITAILNRLGFAIANSPSDPGFSFIPIDRINSVIVMPPDDKAMKVVMEWKDRLDTPDIHGKNVSLVQLMYWKPAEFIAQMTTILEHLGSTIAKSPGDPGISFIPIEYIKSILVISPDDNTMKIVTEWKDRLDTPESAGIEIGVVRTVL